MTTCRSCGYEMDEPAPICGNCGHPTSGGAGRFRAPAPGDSLGAPGGPLAAGSGPLAALVKPLVALLVVGGLGLVLFGPAQEFVARITGIVDDFEAGVGDGGIDLPPPETIVGGGDPPAGYPGVKDIAADLRAGGIRCRRVAIDASDTTVESGSCTVDGAHVQMIVYRTRAALEFATAHIYGNDWPVAYVHDDNWFVSTTAPLARKVEHVLGGTLSTPPGS